MLFVGVKIAGVVAEFSFNRIFSNSIAFNPSNKYLTLKAISNESPSKVEGIDSEQLPTSWASADINIVEVVLSPLILTTLLCWSAKTATLSNEEINFKRSISIFFSKLIWY